mgnify:CR=1 FL=1
MNDSTKVASKGRRGVITVVKIVGAFLSLLMGSGFSTGQEALQFFAAFGYKGIAAISIFLLLGIYMTVSFLLAGQKHGFKNNEEVFRFYAGDTFGKLFSLYAIVTLYSVYVVMLSSAGSVLHESYGLPIAAGASLMGLLVLGALYFGLREIVNVLGALGPALIVAILFIAIVVISRDPASAIEGSRLAPSLDSLRAADSWWLSGMLYPALVAIGLASFMPPLGAKIDSTRQLVVAGTLGPLLFALTLSCIVIALFSGMPDITEVNIPMLYLANTAVPVIAPLFSGIITVCIFTTAVPLLWATLVRFSLDGSRRYHLLAVCLTVFGVIGATALPFGGLLNIIYPTIGYSGFILLALMVVKQVRTRSLS